MLMSKLAISAEVYKRLIKPEILRGKIQGELPSAKFKESQAALQQAGLLLEEDENRNMVCFTAPSSNSGEFFAASLEDLLAASTRRKQVPSHFFIAGEEQIYTPKTQGAPGKIQGYLDAVSFYNILKDIADHGKGIDSDLLVFFHKEKVEIDIAYSEEDLQPLPGLKKFKEKFIDDEIHKEQKQTIVKAILLEFYKEFDSDLKLSRLIERFEEFARRVSSSYQLYVSEFSFQKVKAEIEKSKFEFITKINKVFSDIQNQLLTVPAALFIAGSQFESANTATLKNVIIFVGVAVFTAFMILLILNQKNTLKSIIHEIDNEWNLIKKKHESIKAQFNEQYSALITRYKYQYILLEVVCFISLLAFSATSLLFLYNSDNKTIPVQSAMTMGFGLIAYLCWRSVSTWNTLFFVRVEPSR
jgi:hypothetical protein